MIIRVVPCIWILAIFNFPAQYIQSSFAAEADVDRALNQQERSDKRLAFSQYIDQETLRRAVSQAKKGKAAPPPAKNWAAQFTSLYGYDSNVNLDSSRRGDGFAQESVTLSYTGEHRTLPIFKGKGKFGMSGYQEVYNYFSFEELAYTYTKASLYTDNKFNDRLSFKLPFDFGMTRYPDDDQITYFSYKLKPTLTHFITKEVSHFAYGTVDIKNFRDRKAETSTGATGVSERQDFYYEPGYGLRWMPDMQTLLGVSAGWKKNDSNDEFQDTSDYTGYKVNGYFYRKLNRSFSAIGFFGFDHRGYASREFSNRETPNGIEEDDLFYLGSSLYYDFKKIKGLQLSLTYLYKQNDSNDPTADYTGYTLSTGLNFTF